MATTELRYRTPTAQKAADVAVRLNVQGHDARVPKRRLNTKGGEVVVTVTDDNEAIAVQTLVKRFAPDAERVF